MNSPVWLVISLQREQYCVVLLPVVKIQSAFLHEYKLASADLKTAS